MLFNPVSLSRPAGRKCCSRETVVKESHVESAFDCCSATPFLQKDILSICHPVRRCLDIPRAAPPQILFPDPGAALAARAVCAHRCNLLRTRISAAALASDTFDRVDGVLALVSRHRRMETLGYGEADRLAF